MLGTVGYGVQKKHMMSFKSVVWISSMVYSSFPVHETRWRALAVVLRRQRGDGVVERRLEGRCLQHSRNMKTMLLAPQLSVRFNMIPNVHREDKIVRLNSRSRRTCESAGSGGGW